MHDTNANAPKADRQHSVARSPNAKLAEHPFFKGLTAEQLETIAGYSMQWEFAAGELVFREGDPANRFFVILEGEVALESPVRDGAAVPIQTIGPGDVLGWSWLFAPYYWHFDARAVKPTTAIFFYATPLREECERDHDLGYELMKRVAEVVIGRLQATRHQLVSSRKQ